MSNSYEWLQFVDLDRIATVEEREKLLEMMVKPHPYYAGIANRSCWSSFFGMFRLKDIILSFAIVIDNCQMIRCVSKLNITMTVPFYCAVNVYDLAHDKDTRIFMIDVGIKYPFCYWDMFVRYRDNARIGAIVAMGAVCPGRSRERGVGKWKDISRIIGRLIWESRKFYTSDSSTKRIKK